MAVRASLCHLQHVFPKTTAVYGLRRLWATIAFQTPQENGMSIVHRRVKTVFVHQYRRFRFGKTESVCQHWRSNPNQLLLFV
jgi:hypothetical protein